MMCLLHLDTDVLMFLLFYLVIEAYTLSQCREAKDLSHARPALSCNILEL